jgi:uncharacterized protein YprB with RNaseH-like and TPR domain
MSATLKDRLRGIVGSAVPRVSPDVVASDRPAEAGRHDEAGRGGSGAEAVAFGESAGTAGRVPASDGIARVAADALGGRVVDGHEGAVVVVERDYLALDRHGRSNIGEVVDALTALPEALATLRRAWRRGESLGSGARPDSRFPAPDSRLPIPPPDPVSRLPSRSLWFLDLETTGLAGGAGTQAFLVGCASVDDDGLHVRQFLLPGYEHERALLDEVGAWIAARGMVVTFNGKSFDVPLIETRYLFHRIPFPMEDLPHVDMLHAARRLWRARGALAGSADASCSLATLERTLAGVHRVGDVPGFEIPSRYFQFIRGGDPRPLQAVLEHNRLDLVSLALVMARALTLIDRGPGATRDPYECLGLARIYDRAGLPDEAEASYMRAVDRLERVGRDPETCGDALRRLAWCRRRSGRLREAADAWQRLVDLPQCPAAYRREAREALAIHHEHRSRDLAAARALVLDLLGDVGGPSRRDAAHHRLQRLDRKLTVRRASAPTLPLS